MRKLACLALICFGVFALAQNGGNQKINIHGWEVVNDQLVWSQVYFAESRSIDDFVKGLQFLARRSSVLTLSEKDIQTMSGTFSNLSLKFEEYGYSMIDTPFLISRARHSGKIEVEIKEGRYKVVVSDVVSFLNTRQKQGSIYKWNEDFLDRKGQIKKEMIETLQLADINFTQSFDIKAQLADIKKP
jgi:hypothetical protein